MNTLAFVAFALWALFMRYLPKIMEFIKLKQWSASIPGPTMAELIENVRKGQILNWFKELHKKHGPTFQIWLGKDLTVYFSDPDDVKQILSNTSLLYKSKVYDGVIYWLGLGLITNGGGSWHTRRKFLTPAFHFRILSEFKESMEENCKVLAQRLEEKATGEMFDIYPYITLFALDVICETAMGIKKNAQMQSNSEYVKAVEDSCNLYLKKTFSLWQSNNPFYKFTRDGRQRDAAAKILHGETNRVIKLRRKMLQDLKIHSQKDAEESHDGIGGKKRFAFLDMLLISQMEGAPLSDTEIREEVDTFMFGGHDTTSSAIGFALYLLSQHPDAQQQAYEESISLEGREKETMPYVEAVIKETLRLYPSLPAYSRSVTQDIKVGQLTVPKGANVGILAYMVHRNEKYYPEPEQFKPTRFLQSDRELHPYSFVAFSAGPRNCIGQKFAMLEMKCVLSYLLRKFEFLPAEGYEPHLVPAIVIKSANGIQIRLKSRS